jgi:hypothetical protein
VVERGRAPQFVHARQGLFQALRHTVEEERFVQRSVRAALGAGPVVRDGDDQRVVQLADLCQEVQQAADMVVGV